ncbi:MAG: hypothetical protein EOO37_03085, partial [Cytophagaceae bacterium]
MNISDLSRLATFLCTAHVPIITKTQPTFFSIAGINHKEVPLSNTYAFFFRSEEPHGVGTLFTDALWDLLITRYPDLPKIEGPIHAICERPMQHRQRLDILVHNGQNEHQPNEAPCCILIENKVNHWIANDLDNYWASVSAKNYKVGVVLGRQTESLPSEWVYITHQALAQAIERRLGPLVYKANPRYLPVLLHFLEHLKQMSHNAAEFAQAFAFAQKHREQISHLQEFIQSLVPSPQFIGQV